MSTVLLMSLTAAADPASEPITLPEPVTLPEVVARPDPLEPGRVRRDDGEPTSNVAVGPVPMLRVTLQDPGTVVMLTSTVDTPPTTLQSEPTAEGPTCDVLVEIDHRGIPERVRVERCDDERLAKRARRKVRRLRFEPAVYEGRAVAVADFPLVVAVDGP